MSNKLDYAQPDPEPPRFAGIWFSISAPLSLAVILVSGGHGAVPALLLYIIGLLGVFDVKSWGVVIFVLSTSMGIFLLWGRFLFDTVQPYLVISGISVGCLLLGWFTLLGLTEDLGFTFVTSIPFLIVMIAATIIFCRNQQHIEQT